MYKPFSKQVPANKIPKLPNQFVSDGSFMEQFLKQQQSTASSPPTTSPTDTDASKNLSFAVKKTVIKPIAKPMKTKAFGGDDEDEEEGQPAGKRAKSSATTDSSQSGSATSSSLQTLNARLGEEEVEVIDRFVDFVSQHGQNFVEVTKEKSKDNPKFRFLFDETSTGHKYYTAKLADLAAREALLAEQQILEQAMAASQSYSPPSSMTPHTSSVHYHPPMPESITTLALASSSGASPTAAQADDSNDLKRKRSRWGQTPSAVPQSQSQPQPQPQPQNPSTSLTASYSPSSSASPPSSVSSTSFSSTRQVYSSSYTPKSSHTSSSSLPTSPHTSSSSSLYARGTLSNSTPLPAEKNRNFSPAPQPARQFKKYSDTYKPGMIRVGSKWVYPEDEITEGGTWEHKKRAEEMKKTAEKAAVLTAHAQGKRAHHIADYLPKTELERFEAQVGAAKSGSAEPEFEDYADKKLNESNKGFEMLMKQGWKVGSGLGKEGAGVVAPVNKAEQAPDKAGLGQEKPDGVTEEDDEFEIYRKRMMLAYRFRPNPLVSSWGWLRQDISS
ncbi:hypothetical protein BC937DRAFT_89653 [Endogone sp. FLAS-F59071]|nr:hypothetical protein BC937DRAFT_89653 [Endogone sp. FLAS-F59071]|eukprot:RUS22324.1 hypothetical protein BC937DRAFT_89653 [Endogone sp. FLAS-F59071]